MWTLTDVRGTRCVERFGDYSVNVPFIDTPKTPPWTTKYIATVIYRNHLTAEHQKYTSLVVVEAKKGKKKIASVGNGLEIRV